MLGPLIIVVGMVLVVACALGMHWCESHDQFGTVDGALPHYTTYLAGALWVPMFIGISLVAGGLGVFVWEYRP